MPSDSLTDTEAASARDTNRSLRQGPAERCETCMYWTPFDAEKDGFQSEEWMQEMIRNGDMLPRRRLIAEKRLGLCARADGIKVDEETMAIAEDGSDYIARFRTAATFGCVMHGPKEPT